MATRSALLSGRGLAATKRQPLSNTLREAAKELRRGAMELELSHTIDAVWPEEEAHVRAEVRHLRKLARQLGQIAKGMGA